MKLHSHRSPGLGMECHASRTASVGHDANVVEVDGRDMAKYGEHSRKPRESRVIVKSLCVVDVVDIAVYIRCAAIKDVVDIAVYIRRGAIKQVGRVGEACEETGTSVDSGRR